MAAVVIYVDLARAPDLQRSGDDRQDRFRVHPSSMQALAIGREIGSAWGATVYAAVILHDGNLAGDVDTTGRVAMSTPLAGVNALKQELAKAGADRVVVAISDAPVMPLWSTLGIAWSGVLDHLRPRLVLFGADAPSTSELAARSGARIGARLLDRASCQSRGGINAEVELRDREGTRVRAGDSGAAVASVVGGKPHAHVTSLQVEVMVLALPGTDPRIELAAVQPADVGAASTAIVALGDDALDPAIVATARRLADALGAQLVGGPLAAKVGAIRPDAVVERGTALAPELAVVIGGLAIDLAGVTTLVRVGVDVSGKGLEGLLPPPISNGLDELVRALEQQP
ncbi:MAG: hypothetical protein NT062_22915 [Proteobacteria bacterium]|nr:hypothetical protein [Pseudomonadota bacterium]